MTKKIKIKCKNCFKIYEVKRTNEIPLKVVSITCNWCPKCEHEAKDYYKEWFNYK